MRFNSIRMTETQRNSIIKKDLAKKRRMCVFLVSSISIEIFIDGSEKMQLGRNKFDMNRSKGGEENGSCVTKVNWAEGETLQCGVRS